MSKLIKNFDRSGRKPRQHQITGLQYIEDTWASPTTVLQAGTGVGKSGIGVALILEHGGVYVVPTNVLMDQLIRDYPNINYLKGMDHYTCSRLPDNPKLNCSDAKEIYGTSCPIECDYQRSVQRCLDGEPTFVNPFSYIFVKKREGFKQPNVMVVDECHTLLNSFMLMSGATLNPKVYGKPKSLTTPDTLIWLGGVKQSLRDQRKATEKGEHEKIKKLNRRIDKISEVYKGLSGSPHVYTIYNDIGGTCIKPITPPKTIIDAFFGGTKNVLMSATINTPGVKELLQHEEFEFTEIGTPIPADSRQVKVEPAVFPMNYKTEPKLIASWIKSKMRKYPDRNTIVHLTYSDVEKLKPFFPGCIANTKDTKDESINKFKEEGGLFLAAACSEGLDLPGEECRLNLVPRMSKPNLGDPAVKKRRGLDDGDTWYNLQIMQTLIQQAGRSTRGVDDSSITIVGDKNFRWVWGSVKKLINKDFNESLKWSKRC